MVAESKTKDMDFDEIEAGLGAVLEDVEDKRDYMFDEVFGDVVVDLPEVVKLSKPLTPVKSQGSRGTCVGFATTAAAEYFNANEHNEPDLDLSEEFLYHFIKQIDIADYNYEGYGSYLRSGVKALIKYGTCREALAPYNRNGGEFAWKDFEATAEMLEQALDFRAVAYLNTKGRAEDIAKAIHLTDSPVLVGVHLYSNYREAKNNGGIIPKPEGEKIGGHAMLAVEVDFKRRMVKFKNSWNTSWGDDGYVWIPFDVLSGIGFYGAWAFTDLITNPYIMEQKKKAENRKKVSDYALSAWDKATQLGLVSGDSVPTDGLTKQDFFVFKDRAGELDVALERQAAASKPKKKSTSKRKSTKKTTKKED